LGTYRTPDATIFSWDVAVQKARTALFYSRGLERGTPRAFSSRSVGFLSQDIYPPGIGNNPPGPLFGLQAALSLNGGTVPSAPINLNVPNGITIFPGGFPLYRNGVLIGAIGVSGDGIERAFADVFELMDHCRFRDCKHDREPGCAVRAAIDDGRLDPRRFASLERLVAEEAALEEEQRRRERLSDRRTAPRGRDASDGE
jgi:hypothetical protein